MKRARIKALAGQPLPHNKVSQLRVVPHLQSWELSSVFCPTPALRGHLHVLSRPILGGQLSILSQYYQAELNYVLYLWLSDLFMGAGATYPAPLLDNVVPSGVVIFGLTC
jgi:hypothetical protein